ncbi:MAG: alpha-methylacyl-CoA racemase [Glaciecola sp.]|jgi:alpha-methylacyl-CoA racemase
MPGPLHGITIIELAGIGPGPFAGMMLADLGAEVIRVDRPGGNGAAAVGHGTLNRSRRAIAVDLKNPAGAEVILRLCEKAHGIFEGNRPGVAERLGVGPDSCLARNPALVYGRMTGWGQDGPLAPTAGHDINYIALTGALDVIGRSDSGPVPPLNLVGDFGGGATMLVIGMLAALLHAKATGTGQVVDTAMVDGASLLLSMQRDMADTGMWGGGRGGNLLDTGAHFYDVYETADGKWISLGAIESPFYAQMVALMGLDEDLAVSQMDVGRWPELRDKLAARVREQTRDEWDAILSGTDACYAPVLTMQEATTHPHNVAREGFVDVGGTLQPRPTPRFSATPSGDPRPMQSSGQNSSEVLRSIGCDEAEIADLLAQGAVAQD